MQVQAVHGPGQFRLPPVENLFRLNFATWAAETIVRRAPAVIARAANDELVLFGISGTRTAATAVREAQLRRDPQA